MAFPQDIEREAAGGFCWLFVKMVVGKENFGGSCYLAQVIGQETTEGYGSKRLGVRRPNVQLAAAPHTAVGCSTTFIQGGALQADKNVKRTQNKTGGLDGGNSIAEALQGNSVPTVGKVPGAEDLSKDYALDQNRGHEIGQMDTKGIPYLGNNGNWSARPIEQGSNNERRP